MRYYVERTSPLQPIQLVRTPGFRRRVRGSRASARSRAADVLLVSLGATAGWRGATPELAASLRARRARASRSPRPRAAREWRTFALHRPRAGARRARAPRGAAIAAHRPRAIVYSSTTAALLAPAPGRDPLRRAGRRQPPRPPRALAAAGRAPPACRARRCSCRGARAGWPRRRAPHADAVVVPVPVEPSGRRPPAARDVAALAYAADPRQEGPRPRARRLGAARRDGRDAASSPACDGPRRGRGRASGRGLLPREDYRALLRRARVFVAAPRREDYGIAQLEALADGCRARHDAGAGPVRRRSRSRARSTRGSSPTISPARSAPRSTTPRRATRSARAELLAPYRPRGGRRVVREQLLPRLVSRHDPDLRPVRPHHRRRARDRRRDRPPARRARRRACRSSASATSTAVAADCPGSVTLRGRRHRPRRARRRRRRHGRGVRRHRHASFANAGIGAAGFVPHDGPGRVRARASRST